MADFGCKSCPRPRPRPRILINLFLSIVADVGGNLGLFLGCSILTVAEFIDFLIVYYTEKFNERRKVIQTDKNIDIEAGKDETFEQTHF